jgi:hypothetical protein
MKLLTTVLVGVVLGGALPAQTGRLFSDSTSQRPTR